MQKINLLYVITKLELGGAQRQLLDLIRSLNKDKLHIFLFTASNGILMEDALMIDGLTIKRSSWLERPIHPLKDIFALIELYNLIRKNNIALVHTHSSKAGIIGRVAAKLAGVKIIIHTVHGWPFHDYQGGLQRKIFIWLERLCASLTHKIIVVSKYDLETGLKNHIGDKNKYAQVHYGIEHAEFNGHNHDVRKELGVSPADKLIGMTACFKEQKAPQDFIRAASLVAGAYPQAKFILVGDGVLRKEIESEIKRLHLKEKMILTGWRRDMPRVLSGIDIFALTSLWEGLPISALEAMASAKPVVATNTGGISEVVQEGKNGFLVAPRDTQDLSEKLILLLRDENLRVAMGQNALVSLNHDFRREDMVNAHQGIYEKLLMERGDRVWQ